MKVHYLHHYHTDLYIRCLQQLNSYSSRLNVLTKSLASKSVSHWSIWQQRVVGWVYMSRALGREDVGRQCLSGINVWKEAMYHSSLSCSNRIRQNACTFKFYSHIPQKWVWESLGSGHPESEDGPASIQALRPLIDDCTIEHILTFWQFTPYILGISPLQALRHNACVNGYYILLLGIVPSHQLCLRARNWWFMISKSVYSGFRTESGASRRIQCFKILYKFMNIATIYVARSWNQRVNNNNSAFIWS